jgi:hypothetical protein
MQMIALLLVSLTLISGAAAQTREQFFDALRSALTLDDYNEMVSQADVERATCAGLEEFSARCIAELRKIEESWKEVNRLFDVARKSGSSKRGKKQAARDFRKFLDALQTYKRVRDDLFRLVKIEMLKSETIVPRAKSRDGY